MRTASSLQRRDGGIYRRVNPVCRDDYDHLMHCRERLSLEERGPADAELALALVHHLAIANDAPLAMIAGFLSHACRWLLSGFVPNDDSQAQGLLATREDSFPAYTQDTFEQELGTLLAITDAVQVEDSRRTMCLMQRRQP